MTSIKGKNGEASNFFSTKLIRIPKMKIRRTIFSFILMCFCLSGSVRADESYDQNRPGPKSILKWLLAYLDSSAVDGIDQRYIEVPKKPWQIVVRSNINQSDLKMRSYINAEAYTNSEQGKIQWEPRIRTDVTTYAGAWVGYRGFGIGMAKNVGGDKGNLFTLAATSSKYSLNLRIHHFQTDNPVVHMEGYITDENGTDEYNNTEHFLLFEPIKVKTVMFDGVYFFNSKKFSNLAAYDQSTIQRRSAGSPVLGAMMFYSKVSYDEPLNNDLIFFMNNIGRIKQWQASIGGGYAYNWVIGKNFMVNATVMPMVSFYNRLKIYTYDSYLYQQAIIDSDDYDDDVMINYDKWWIKPLGKKTVKGRVKLNYDARLSLTYNLKDWFFNVNGQFSNFRYKHASSSGRLNDWYVNASVGLRL